MTLFRANSGPDPENPEGPDELKSILWSIFTLNINDMMAEGQVELLVGIVGPVVGQSLAVNMGWILGHILA